MPEINLFGLGNQSKSLNISATDRTNLYYEIYPDPDKSKLVAYGTPGFTLFSTLSNSVTRGMYWMESVNKLYVVQRNVLYEVSSDGTFINRGTLSVSPLDDNGRVSMADNGTQLCLFTGINGYIYNTATTVFAQITMPYSGNAGDTVTFLDSYFIVNRPGTGQFYKSASYDGTSWNSLDFATAESFPDNLQGLISDKGYLALFGTSSTELWVNNGSINFPFSRVNAAPSEIGIAARWTMAKIKNVIVALVRNRSGALSIAYLDNYLWSSLSNAELDREISNYISPTDATGYGYNLNGRNFYVITFQTDKKSWLYNFETNSWSRLKSWGIDRYIGEIGKSFDTKFIISDYSNGNLYQLDIDAITENGLPIERQIIGKHIYRQSRNKLSIRRLRVEFEGGVGLISGQGNDPKVMLKISRDGGHTYGNDLWTTIGHMGEYDHRAEWRRLGIARDWVFKLRITDPVKIVIMNAVIEAQELNK